MREIPSSKERRFSVVELGEQAGDLGACRAQALAELVDSDLEGERAQHVDQRTERDSLAAELDAPADEHARAGLLGSLG